MQTIEQALEKLQRSDFRAKFHLSARERAYAEEKGMDVIRKHAVQFVADRLAPAEPFSVLAVSANSRCSMVSKPTEPIYAMAACNPTAPAAFTVPASNLWGSWAYFAS